MHVSKYVSIYLYFNNEERLITPTLGAFSRAPRRILKKYTERNTFIYIHTHIYIYIYPYIYIYKYVYIYTYIYI